MRNDDGHAQVTANSRNSRPTMPPIIKMGMNTATSEMADGDHGEADLLGSLERGRRRRVALLESTAYVFDDDDGVVDYESGRDRQRHQRQIVEAVTDRYMTPKVPMSENGTATLGMKRGAHAPEENEHHQMTRHTRSRACARRRARSADGLRVWSMSPISRSIPGESSRCTCARQRLRCRYGLDDVGAGLAEDDTGAKACRWSTPRRGCSPRHRTPVADVPGTRRPTVHGRHDHRSVIVGAENWSLDAMARAARRPRRGNLWGRIGVVAPDAPRARPPGPAPIACRAPPGFSLHPHGRLLHRRRRSPAPPRSSCEISGRGSESATPIVDRPRQSVSEVSARIRIGESAGIDLAVGRIAGQVGGQIAAGGVDGGLDVARGGVDVAVQIELQGDRGRTQVLVTSSR